MFASSRFDTAFISQACHVVTRLTRMLRKLGISALPLTGQMSQDRRQTSLGAVPPSFDTNPSHRRVIFETTYANLHL